MSAVMTVDQELVDTYLSRVDRFVNNIQNFENTLKEMTGSLKDKFMSNFSEQEESAHQEIAAAEPEQAVVTADDIDLDALLSGIDLGAGMAI